MALIEPVLPVQRPWPLYDVASTRSIEQAAAAKLPAHTLMKRAGEAVAALAMAVAPHARRVWIAAGPGNNGGDGFDAAIHLHAAGREVRVHRAGAAAQHPADAADALRRAQAAGVPIVESIDEAWLASLTPQDLAIDALLGIGASRAPDAALGAALARFNALSAVRLAVDIPSGLGADTGAGSLVARCDHTLSLLTLKPGLFTGQGRDAVGRVWWCPLGTEVADSPLALIGRDAALSAPPRPHASHKGRFGDLAIVGGAAGMTGAALLAGRAGIGAGAGRVYVVLLDGGSMACDPQHPELMFRPRWLDDEDAAALARATVVAGCGGGDAIRAMLPRALGPVARLVLDADALNAIASDAALARGLEARAARGRGTVLTPHPLEAARLLGSDAAAVQADRLGAARALAQRFRTVVLLKGSGTVIVSPDGRAAINGTGNAALASAGTGDVLAGWIGGVWSADPEASGFEVACRVVALHGWAAEAVRHGPLPATELIAAMQRRLRG
jgi:hydroxyethylthiazole kinase-like uncharacterized protein yjeF